MLKNEIGTTGYTYYIPKAEAKDYTVMSDCQTFSEQPETAL